MAGFHNDAIFPVDIAYGSQGGPGGKTNIIEMDSGAEERIVRLTEARRQWNAAYGVRSHTQLAALRTFYIARRGPAHGFRFLDYHDCNTNGSLHPDMDGGAAAAFDDEILAVADGVTTVFQLKRRYTDAGITRTTNITKPITSSTKVGVDGVESTSGWSVNEDTGEVTFSVAPVSGNVTGGTLHYWPARFAKEVDDVLNMTIDAYGYGSSENVPIIQLLDGEETPDEFQPGGSKVHDPMSADVTLSVGLGKAHSFWNLSAARILYFPDYTNLAGGGPYFMCVNEDSVDSITFKDHPDNGGASFYTHTAGDVAEVWLIHNKTTGLKYWYVV